MLLRVISGKVKPGAWSDYEAAYLKATQEAGPSQGLCGRWLTRDLDDPDAGTTISLWANAEALRAYEESDALRKIIQPQLAPFFTGEYRTSRSIVRFAEGDPAPADWVGSDN